MDRETLRLGVAMEHIPFVEQITGKKVLQVGDAFSGVFVDHFEEDGRDVSVQELEKLEGSFDVAYCLSPPDDLASFAKKVLRHAEKLVFIVPGWKWVKRDRPVHHLRTPEELEAELSKFRVKVFYYWEERLICVVVTKGKKEARVKEVAEIKKAVKKEAVSFPITQKKS